MTRIFLSPPDMQGKELEYLTDAFKSNWIAPVGPYLERFENYIKTLTNCGHAVAVASGTAAIDLSLRMLGVEAGDVVLSPSLTFVASIAPAVHIKAQPIFIDCKPNSWNIDPDLLEEEIKRCLARGKKPKAMIIVHLYGYTADMERIKALSDEYDIPIVEDASESLGATFDGQHTGTFGILGLYSFNGNKIITTSSGGMLVSKSEDLIKRARHLSTQARQPAPHYEHTDVGFNYRMSNLLAAVGLGQVEQLEAKIARRKKIFTRYVEALTSHEGIAFLPEDPREKPNYWLSCCLFDASKFGCDRETVRKHLDERGIESRPIWKPMHLQPVFKDARMVGGQVCEAHFSNGLCLPSGSGMSDAQQEEVIARILECRSNSL